MMFHLAQTPVHIVALITITSIAHSVLGKQKLPAVVVICKHEFVVPASTSAYRCYECQAVSNSTSRENNGANGASPSLSTTITTGNKRAVLCGVTYNKRQIKLRGTVNDVIKMKDLLVNIFQFPIQFIRVLTGIYLHETSVLIYYVFIQKFICSLIFLVNCRREGS